MRNVFATNLGRVKFDINTRRNNGGKTNNGYSLIEIFHSGNCV